MRAVVTGAAGQLGRAVVGALEDVQAVALDRQALDVSDDRAVRAMMRDYNPQVIVNCAAFTRVDDCEDDPEPAWAVNAAGASHLAQAAQASGAFLVHVSTDYVFDGTLDRPYTEFDRTAPVSVYGRTKEAGEQLVRLHCPSAAIVRAAWLHGPEGSNFVRTMLRLGTERDRVQVVTDQVGTPTFTYDLAPVIAELAARRPTGTFHVTNTGSCSWYELCEEAFRLAGIDTPIEPIDAAAFGARAPRPANSRLEGRHAAMVGLPAMPPWQESLARLVAELRP